MRASANKSMKSKNTEISRRHFGLGCASAAVFSPTVLSASESQRVRRNSSAFRIHRWQDHFESLDAGVILSDTKNRVLQHWTSDGEMRVYPTSVPLSEDLTKLGYTEVVEKRMNPSWAPTPAMRERNPEWPLRIPGGAPENPLGTRALYLSWQYYRIHGTQDTRKIGRRSSNGCIGLYNRHIEEVFERTPIGTLVKLL